jgi:hypothetical protein
MRERKKKGGYCEGKRRKNEKKRKKEGRVATTSTKHQCSVPLGLSGRASQAIQSFLVERRRDVVDGVV